MDGVLLSVLESIHLLLAFCSFLLPAMCLISRLIETENTAIADRSLDHTEEDLSWRKQVVVDVPGSYTSLLSPLLSSLSSARCFCHHDVLPHPRPGKSRVIQDGLNPLNNEFK